MNTQLFFAVLMQLLALYVVTVGIGMVIGGSAGARRAHLWWLRVTTRTIAWCLSGIADLLRWLASQIKR